MKDEACTVSMVEEPRIVVTPHVKRGMVGQGGSEGPREEGGGPSEEGGVRCGDALAQGTSGIELKARLPQFWSSTDICSQKYYTNVN